MEGGYFFLTKICKHQKVLKLMNSGIMYNSHSQNSCNNGLHCQNSGKYGLHSQDISCYYTLMTSMSFSSIRYLSGITSSKGDGALIRKEALIVRRALNQIIMVYGEPKYQSTFVQCSDHAVLTCPKAPTQKKALQK